MTKRVMDCDDGPPARKKLLYGWSPEDVAKFLEQEEEETKMSEEERAFGELDFYKRFWVECLLKSVDRRLSLQELRRMKDVKCEAFESHLCSLLSVRQQFPLKTIPPGAPKSLTFSCEVDEFGRVFFQKPFYEEGKTPLQRAFGDDKVLQVHFSNKNITAREIYRDIMRRSIVVGFRHFDYFVHKEGKQSKSVKKKVKSQKQRCFFVCTKSSAASDRFDSHFLKFHSVEDCQKYMMHIHTVHTMELYSKRLQLALSKTSKADIDLKEVDVIYEDDIPCKSPDGKLSVDPDGKIMIHTDGTGLISEDLARKCTGNMGEAYPALIQVRLFYHGMAIKGTLFVLKTLPAKTIVYRESMLKVKSDPQLVSSPSFNSLEICTTSRKPRRANLSRYIIALLMEGGVPESLLLQAVQDAIAKAETPLQDIRAAYKLCSKFTFGELPRRMILAGIPLCDHFLRTSLNTLIRIQLVKYGEAKVPLEGSFYLMGTADPTNTLRRHQVAIVLENGPLHRDKVLVYKHPGMHPGDVHVFEATWNQELEHHVGHAKYVIIFPMQGPRSVVDEIANSDLDGDMYWICVNEQVIKSFTAQSPWQRKSMCKTSSLPKPSDPYVIRDRLVTTFLKSIFEPNLAICHAATNWLIHMDKYLSTSFQDKLARENRQNRLLELVEVYYKALDSQKTGEEVRVSDHLREYSKPHFLYEKDATYESDSIFGKIYNLVAKASADADTDITAPLLFYKEFIYGNYLDYKDIWKRRYEIYRLEMNIALNESDEGTKETKAKEVIEKYCEMLFTGSIDLEGAQKRVYQIYEESCAIYSVVFDHAQATLQSTGKCSFSFAWRVAGEPLCNLYCDRRGGGTVSVAKDVLGLLAGLPVTSHRSEG